MKQSILIILLGLFTLWSSPSAAQDAQPSEADVITAVRKGQPAPYDGQLFDVKTAIRWGQWLQNADERAQLQVDKEKSVCRVELDYREEIASAQLQRQEEISKDLKARLLRSEKARAQAEHDRDNPSWYQTTWFGAALGAVGAGGLMYLGSRTF